MTLERTGRTPIVLARAMRSRVMTFASDTSYGVYLFHGFLISLGGHVLADTQFDGPTRAMLLAAIVVPGTYCAGYLSLRWVESPCIKLGRRLLNRDTRIAPPDVQTAPAASELQPSTPDKPRG